MALRVIAASSTVLEIGPIVSIDQTPRIRPWRLTLPQLGLRPTIPHQAAGPRIEPPVSSPRELAQRESGCNRPGAAAGATCPHVQVPWIPRCGVTVRTSGYRELAHVRLAQEDSACSLEVGYSRGIFVGDEISQDTRATGAADSFSPYLVFDRYGDTVHGPQVITLADGLLRLPGSLESLFADIR